MFKFVQFHRNSYEMNTTEELSPKNGKKNNKKAKKATIEEIIDPVCIFYVKTSKLFQIK